MSDLFLTKTRLALLRAVATGVVFLLPDDSGGLGTFDTTDAEDGYEAKRVTARVDELERAGWVYLRADAVTWDLTDAGRAVLAGVS